MAHRGEQPLQMAIWNHTAAKRPVLLGPQAGAESLQQQCPDHGPMGYGTCVLLSRGSESFLAASAAAAAPPASGLGMPAPPGCPLPRSPEMAGEVLWPLSATLLAMGEAVLTCCAGKAPGPPLPLPFGPGLPLLSAATTVGELAGPLRDKIGSSHSGSESAAVSPWSVAKPLCSSCCGAGGCGCRGGAGSCAASAGLSAASAECKAARSSSSGNTANLHISTRMRPVGGIRNQFATTPS